MNIIVQKYGGTSTRSFESRERMYKNIIRDVKAGHKVVAVVSAMGRFDDPYATDTLLSIVNKEHLDSEELDRLTSLGETIATLVIKAELEKNGIAAATISNQELGILTDRDYQNASIIEVDGEMILEKLKEAEVVICPGFQGRNEEGKITTLGRGGSDLSAVAVGIAVEASEVEIYSDVNGIYTADPRIVPDALKLNYISYAEMLELACNGAKVLNHRCVQLAASHNIRIHARSSFEQYKGTYVIGDEEIMKKSLNKLTISGITGSQNEARVTLVGVDGTNNSSAKFFQRVAEEGVNVNVFNQALVGGGKMDISLIIRDEDLPKVIDICNELKQPLKAQRTIVRGNIGKVSVIGIGIKNNQGMFHKVYNTLIKNDIPVEMTSCSEINISCFIDRDDVNRAQVVLHEAFLGNEN